ncbi:unnamed protein product [Ilex paraguariensis]|uniref:Uncharacterized protein n=1 Tax=Ilex paraguariensis TaxID=185542 RepID=A0ABC8SLV6_9AQUA
MTLSFPLKVGRTRVTAFATPVEVGTMLRAVAHARLRSLWLASRNLWSLVSTTETLGVRTWKAMTLSFPLKVGRTRVTAFATPVEVGTMLRAVAHARLRSLWLASRNLWSLV